MPLRKKTFASRPIKNTLFEEMVINSWWVVIFTMIAYLCYEKGMQYYNEEYQKLHKRITELYVAKNEALEQNMYLNLQVNSQSDPAWVELILIKGLGLVPDGQKKIFFDSKNSSES